ncbi:Vacuolar sorting protein 9 subgroup [Penicillium cf. griseofulvum]|nr:Vacuolar sorting protein 9 subgroup [Penicillium cf. griseofulvum]
MSATESPSSPGPETRDLPHIHESTETPAAPTDLLVQTQDDLAKPDSSQTVQMSAQETTEPHAVAALSDPAAMDLTTATQPSQAEQQQLAGQMEELSVSGNKTPNLSSSANTPPPPPPQKDDVYLNPNASSSTTPPTLPPIDTNRTPSPEKELPDVPSDSDPDTKRGGQVEGLKDDNASQPEIQSIMGQFQDPARSTDQKEIMSPRLELAEQLRGGPTYFPPRKSSLDHVPATESAGSPVATSPEKQPVSQHSHKPESPISNRRASTSTVLPLPEPESDQPFDFHRFLEQLRHRTADPVAKFLRSFLMEFGKKQWMVHEQVKIISDFLTFITNKMAMCEIWRDVSDSEFDNAKEGMEKLVMNRLYSQTFSPAIPAPPTIPRSASRSRRRELERLHGPWRRGQHQEDIERDDILAQKIRIYSWVNETHLDIPTVSGGGRRFLNLAQQEISKINGYRAPRDKVICILNCCKVIFGLLKNFKKGDTSADSFIPLLIYVVLHANPDHLISNIQYILRFRNQDKLGGEAGYYISSLSGAIQFIESLDRTSLTVSDEDFDRNVEAAVSAIAEQNRESENFEEKPPIQTPPSQPQAGPSRKETTQSSDDDASAPVAGLLRTIQKPLSTIGRIFSDDPDSGSVATQERPQPVLTPQPSVAPARLTPNVYQPPRASSEDSRRSGDERAHPAHGSGTSAKKNLTRVLDAQDAAARQASAEDAEARRIQRAEHTNVVETLSNMFPNLDRELIDDVVKMKEGRVGLAVDACLALSAE